MDTAKFAKSLSHCEKKIRTKSLNALLNYLKRTDPISKLDFLKIWKGLFFSIYHSDGVLVQQELIKKIAGFLNIIHENNQLSFLKGFFTIFMMEWKTLDRYRIEKFYSCIRTMVYNIFIWLEIHHWDDTLIKKYNSLLSKGPYYLETTTNEKKASLVNSCVGFCLFFSDVFWEELSKVLEGKDDIRLNLELFETQFAYLANGNNKQLITRILDKIFLSMFLSGSPTLSPDHLKSKIFDLAKSRTTRDENRVFLYSLYERFDQLQNESSPFPLESNLFFEFKQIKERLETDKDTFAKKKRAIKIRKRKLREKKEKKKSTIRKAPLKRSLQKLKT